MPNRTERLESCSLQYSLVRSRRRTLSLIVRDDGSLEVRCPLIFPKVRIEKFVREKASWINRKRQENQNNINIGALTADRKAAADRQIRSLIEQIVAEKTLRQPAKIAVRDLYSRWGSCSSRGHVVINRRVASLPRPLQEYVILHELCHLQHLNHSPAFWNKLETDMPDAPQRRKALKYYRLTREEKS